MFDWVSVVQLGFASTTFSATWFGFARQLGSFRRFSPPSDAGVGGTIGRTLAAIVSIAAKVAVSAVESVAVTGATAGIVGS
jgi:hypothetical protein